jgi:hypothetical protein
MLIHYKLRANTDELVIKVMSRWLRKDKGGKTKERQLFIFTSQGLLSYNSTYIYQPTSNWTTVSLNTILLLLLYLLAEKDPSSNVET